MRVIQVLLGAVLVWCCISFSPSKRQASCSSSTSFDAAAPDASFDFSSAAKWEEYYQQGDGLEWHSSVPLETVASYCTGTGSVSVLAVGCGSSRLPDALLANNSNNNNGCTTVLTLLDSSATCISQLKERYKDNVSYVCGDALKLSTTGLDQEFDVIVDKGLLDALLCGEGWNGPVATLFTEAAQILKSQGTYVLVSYRLPKSTQEFLVHVGTKAGLAWQFDCENGSNDRVGISVATKW